MACAGTPAEGVSGGGDVVSLVVSPDVVELATSGGVIAEQQFTAVATFGDGETDELDLVSWELSNASIGSIDSRGRFVSVAENGGEATITATFLDQVGTAQLTIVHSSTYLEEGVDEAGAAALGEVDSGEPGLEIVYPRDETRVPRNLEGLRIFWSGTERSDLVRLRFASKLETVDVYCTDCSDWTVPTAVWEAVSATNKKGTLSVQVFAASWDGSTLADVRQSEPISVTVNRFDSTGSVLYWSTADQAVMRIEAGNSASSRFYPSTQGTGCYGCHEISESRQWMVVTRDGVNGAYQIIDVSDPSAPTVVFDVSESKRMTFHSLSPDGKFILGVESGVLKLFELESNNYVGAVTPDGNRYSHPGWAPDGKSAIAVRVTQSFYSDMTFNGGEIVTMSWDGEKLGTPEVLVAREEGVNYYYPAWSPDGEWLVYNRSTGDAYSDPDAELWMLGRDGGAPVRLDKANGTGSMQNSLARWAPLPDDDILWLAFSSRLPINTPKQNVSQIWVTAIDPELMRSGADPSSAPYWLPGQNVNSDSHLPVWWSQ